MHIKNPASIKEKKTYYHIPHLKGHFVFNHPTFQVLINLLKYIHLPWSVFSHHLEQILYTLSMSTQGSLALATDSLCELHKLYFVI